MFRHAQPGRAPAVSLSPRAVGAGQPASGSREHRRLARRGAHRTSLVEAVRDKPAPFWAMESLLREYPISSAEGLA